MTYDDSMVTHGEKIDLVAVDIGYGFVKAISRNTGKHVSFPSVVGQDTQKEVTDMFGAQPKDIDNLHISYGGSPKFVGSLAQRESPDGNRSLSEQRHKDEETYILLNVAIHLVTDDDTDQVYVSTGLPYDYFSSQREVFKKKILGMQSTIEWKAGSREGTSRRINIRNAIVLPQAMSAIFSTFYSTSGQNRFPDLMDEDNTIGLIDIGFKTTDYIVVDMKEDGLFTPRGALSGTVADVGASNVYERITSKFKGKTGGKDLSNQNLNKILRRHEIAYKGEKIEFGDLINEEKDSVANKIFDEINSSWRNEMDMFDHIFLVGGGGELVYPEMQKMFEDRLDKIGDEDSQHDKVENDSQFANAMGYLQFGEKIINQSKQAK